MKRIHLGQMICCNKVGLLIVFMLILIFLYTDLSANEKTSGFVFNPQSEYWPTKGWKSSTPEKQGMNSKALIEVFEEIEKNDLEVDSLLIVRNGYIVVEANKRHIETLYPIYSSTKSFTSAIIGIALNKGYICSVDQSISEFFPELFQKNINSLKASITLKNLLTMSCGFEWPEVQTDYSNTENPYFQLMQSDNWIKFLLDKPIKEKPGQKFNYNSGCSRLLFEVLYRSGLNVADFAQINLFTPMGILKDQYKWRKTQNGKLNASDALYMSPRNMAKFGYLYLKGGHWEGKQIIPKSWIIESTKRHLKMNWEFFEADDYGYKWYIQSFGFHSAGYNGQFIFVIPKHELVVVFTSHFKQKKMGTAIDLVKAVIIPAVKDLKSLPENEKVTTTLKSKIENFVGI
jgi:CubicO group peptidase (beta-lactamase class C family)